MFRVVRMPVVWIAALAVVAIVVSGVEMYNHLRPSPQPRVAVKAAPVAAVGSTTVTSSTKVEVLNVISTSPVSGAFGEPVTSEITMRFNLAVDPTAIAPYFSVLPTIPGAFRAGTTPQEIIFKPDTPYPAGSPVSVVLRRGFPSLSGVTLQDDYAFRFNTEVSSRDVAFVVGNQLSRVYGAASGQTISVQPNFGNEVPADLKAEIWKASSADLLAAQVHDSTSNYLDLPIGHGDLVSAGSQPIANNQAFSVNEPDGIYLVLADDANGVYGALWIDFSHFGVVLRQDDQKIIVGGENLTTGDTSPTFNITLYNLSGGVQAVASSSFSGTGEMKIAYGTPIDLAVATSGGEDVIIPLQAPQTAADLKLVGDLSTTPQIFLMTDRAGYQAGDTVKFAGIMRTSNDQAYSVPAGASVGVWPQGSSNPVIVTVAADGTFSGSFPIPASAFNADGTDGQIAIYAGSEQQYKSNYSPFFTVVATVASHTPAAKLTVTFDKTAYMAGDNIQASIAAVDSSSKPLASKQLDLSVYATVHAARPAELGTFPAPSTWGTAVVQHVNVTLDAAGHATYAIKANVAGQATDQEITLAATYGTGPTQAIGARSAIVYQAADEVYFLTSRTVYLPGDTIVAPFVVESLAGQRVAGAPMSFELDKIDYQGNQAITTVVGSGTVAANGDGVGVVRAPYSGPALALTLRVKGKDTAGNVFEDALPIAEVADPMVLTSFGQSDSLTQMSVLADKIAYEAGDEAHLTLTAPAATTALMSIERGRIHSYKWIQLVAGDNALSVPITPDLFPGFTLTLSYFRNGSYFTEGMPIYVQVRSRLLKVTAVPDQASYTKGQTAHVKLALSDASGAPVAGSLLVDGYDANMSAYKLVDQPSVGGAFFTPAPRGTNASSSLLGIGSWGGRCGGGGNGPQPAVTNPGATAVWLPTVTTDAGGQATIDVPVTSGSIRLALIASTGTTMLGQAEVDLSVQ